LTLLLLQQCYYLFFFKHPPTTEIYTLSLHDALPIWARGRRRRRSGPACAGTYEGRARSAERRREPARSRQPARPAADRAGCRERDRKSTRLNSSHDQISYAVFCLKKKKKNTIHKKLS